MVWGATPNCGIAHDRNEPRWHLGAKAGAQLVAHRCPQRRSVDSRIDHRQLADIDLRAQRCPVDPEFPSGPRPRRLRGCACGDLVARHMSGNAMEASQAADLFRGESQVVGGAPSLLVEDALRSGRIVQRQIAEQFARARGGALRRRQIGDLGQLRLARQPGPPTHAEGDADCFCAECDHPDRSAKALHGTL